MTLTIGSLCSGIGGLSHHGDRPRDGRGATAADADGNASRRQPRDLHGAQDANGAVSDSGNGPGHSGGRARFGPYAAAVRRQEQWHGPAPEPTTDGRLNPAFVEWMMGYPSGWTLPAGSRNNRLRCLGNAVVPQVAEAFVRSLAAVEAAA